MTNEELVLAIKAGDNVAMYTEQLYLRNRGLIRKAAESLRGLENCDDLMQEGFIGMMRAVDLWDPSRGITFSTYSYYWMRQSMLRYVFDCGRLVRIPEYQSNLIYKYRRAENSYKLKFGRAPTDSEMMDLLDVDREVYDKLLQDLNMVKIRSISEPIGSDDNSEITLGDTVDDDSATMDNVIEKIQAEELSRVIWEIVSKLPKGEQSVLCGKFKQGQTYKECGEELGISPDRVRDLLSKGLRSLRKREVKRRLEPYLKESSAYSIGLRSGYGAFKLNGASAQERAVMRLEYETGPIWKGSPYDWPDCKE